MRLSTGAQNTHCSYYSLKKLSLAMKADENTLERLVLVGEIITMTSLLFRKEGALWWHLPRLGCQRRKDDYLCFSDDALLEQAVKELFTGASDNGIKGKQLQKMLISAL